MRHSNAQLNILARTKRPRDDAARPVFRGQVIVQAQSEPLLLHTVCRIGICRRELNIRLDLVFLQKAVNVCSFCIENKFSPVMSFNGDVVFEENLEYKERAFQILPMLKKMYQEPTNPLFKVFHINIKKIRTFSSAEEPKEYSLE